MPISPRLIFVMLILATGGATVACNRLTLEPTPRTDAGSATPALRTGVAPTAAPVPKATAMLATATPATRLTTVVPTVTPASSPTPVPTPTPTPSPTFTPTVIPTPSPTFVPLPFPTYAPFPTVGATETPTAVHQFLSSPCGGFRSGYRGGLHAGFLDWASGATQLVLDVDEKIAIVDTEGTQARVVVDTAPRSELWPPYRTYGYHADVSPDGNRVVYASCEFPSPEGRYAEGPNPEIAIANVDGTGRQRLTSNGEFDNYPTWSPDGTRIAFVNTPFSAYGNYDPFYSHILMASADGVKAVPNTEGVSLHPPAWSPDGQRLAFTVNEPVEGEYYPPRAYNRILYAIRLDGSDLREIGSATTLPAWSPDGLRVAFGLNDRVYVWESGTSHLSALLYGFRANQMSWSPDGTELLLASDRGVYVVGEDGSNLRALGPVNLRAKDAIWSPDGSMIAARHELLGYSSPRIWETSIFLMARDGTDVRFLAEGFVDDRESNVRASGTRPPSTDPAECSSGVIVPEPERNPGLVKDCQALLWMRNTLILDVVSTWNIDTPMAEWWGVAVRGNPPRVRELLLEGSVSGLYVSSEIGSLKMLEKLDLSDNWLTSIPLELANLTNLRELDLSSNGLTGPIPPELGKLTMLGRLDLAGNDLAGPIPPELGNLTMLEILDLAYNLLTSIPLELANLTNLRELNLSSNSLVGPIPSELDTLTMLKELYLFDNALGVCVPVELPELWVEASGLKRCRR